MELQDGTLAVAERQGGAFLDQVVRQAVYPALWKLLRVNSRCLGSFARTRPRARRTDLLAAGFAGVLVAIARVLELGASLKELEDELVGFTTHPLLSKGLVVTAAAGAGAGAGGQARWT